MTDPSTWTTFSDALAACEGGGFSGIGFVLGDGFVGVDLDACRDRETGDLDPWARDIIDALNSYTELSPSGTGVHVLCRGELPPGRRRKDGVELYDRARYFAVTGAHLVGTPATVKDRTTELAALHREVFGDADGGAVQVGTKPTPVGTLAMTDDDLLDRARAARNGDRFSALFDDGDRAGYASASEADLALCSLLAFWASDAAQVDRLFRASALMRDKWRDRADYRDATLTKALQRGETYAGPRAAPTAQGADGDPADDRPDIICSTNISVMTDALQDALIAVDAPIFARAGGLARVVRGGSDRGIRRDPAAARIEPLPSASLREQAASCARWLRVGAKGDLRPALPHLDALAALSARPSWRFRPLSGIVSTPTLRPDGTILSTAGYDAATGLLLVDGLNIESIADDVGADDASDAIDMLLEPFADFPLVDDADRAAVLAAVLTLIARHAIGGAVPIFSITAPAAGTGKTLLVDAIATIATGRPAPKMSEARDDDEMRKRLLALALAGDPLVLIDNLERVFSSAALSSAVTAGYIRDRVLGRSEMVSLPFDATLLTTGNNSTFRGDIVRRIVPIRLDPGVEEPEARDGFKYPDLLAHIRDRRAELVRAALVILRGYINAERPVQTRPTFGSFTAWQRAVADAIRWATGHDPLGGRPDLREDDAEREALLALLDAIQETGATEEEEAQTSKQLAEDGDVRAAATAFVRGDDVDGRALAYVLRRFKDRVVGGLVLRASRPRANVTTWHIVRTGG